MRKFSTITDKNSGEEFCALCQALDTSIYRRLRTLVERDCKANRRIIGMIPEKGEQFPDRFLPPEEKSKPPTKPPFPLPMTKGDNLNSFSQSKSVKSKQEFKNLLTISFKN
jgi:hypothetical protein